MFEIITKPKNSLFSKEDINKAKSLNPKELEDFTKQKSIAILSNIQRVSEKIEEAERLTREADNVKRDWTDYIPLPFPRGDSKTEKRSKLNTQAIALHNEAIGEMNNLIQESIRFTTCSALFGQRMIETMSAMMVGGFESTDGNLIQLTKEGKKHANAIIQQAENFLSHQEEMKPQDEEQDEQIQSNKKSIWELQKRLEEQDKIDENQTAQIEHNRKLIKDLEQELDEKDILDESQSKDIKSNQESIAKLQEESQKLQEKINQLESQVHKGKYGLFISIGVTILAVVAIVLNFVIKT